MHRLVPEIGAVGFPSGITSAERSHFAAGLDELLELMTSILTMASIRKTGRLPSFRSASNASLTALCVGPSMSLSLPRSLVFDGLFVKRMLAVWDGHTAHEPEDASTYLLVTPGEYVVGVARRELVDAVSNEDDDAVQRGLGASTRITGVYHGHT